MGVNKTILKKVGEKTKDKPEIQNFLIKILNFESEEPGWYKDTYITFLEECYKEEEIENY